MVWKKDIFNNFIKLNRGFDLPEKHIISGDFPVVASTAIKAYHHTYKVEPPCVVTGRSGSLGTVQYVTSRCWPLNTTLYVKDYKGNLPRYVYYFLETMHLDNFNSGAGVPTLNQNHLHKLKIRVPQFHIQERIAAILSAYDDLIENNNRRIAILEKMAEELYREWFVRLRFPGYEKVKIVKGMPEEWEVKRIGEVVSFKYGFTESAIEDNQYPKFLRVMDINKASYIKWSEVPNCKIDENTKEKYELKRDDLVIARMASPGKVAIVERDINAVFASYLIKLSLRKEALKPYYIFYTLRSDYYQGLFTNADTSATRGNINGQIISKFQIIVPPMELQSVFNTKITVIRNQLSNFVLQNEILQMIRDRLLSRLMSGKINVENMGIQFPASMQEELAHA